MDKEVYIENLKKAFENEYCYDSEYINECVSYASKLFENKMPVIFDIVHLSKLLGLKGNEIYQLLINEDAFYKEVFISKKSGGKRVLNIPSVKLKYVQRWILDNVLYNIGISEFACGFCKDKSILFNAKYHLNKKCIVNLDIKDFFPSITYDMIFRVFYYYGYTKEVSFALAKLCTYQGALPQGSPASPYLSNIICLRIDKRIGMLVKKYDGDYSRYADDITLSGSRSIQKTISLVEKILVEEGFVLNQLKTRTAYKGQRQEVTGLIVNNDVVRINKKYKREVMQEIYYCNKFGVDSHLYKIKSEKSFYKEHLYGKVYFINMIEPNTGKKLLEELSEISWEY